MALELNGTTGVSLVQDGVVTAADLASTLDLTGKTVTLPSGTGGKVLQVVTVTKTDTTAFAGANTWWNISGVSASITPASTSNKIVVMCVVMFGCTSGYNGAHFAISRDGSRTPVGDASSSRVSSFYGSDDMYGAGANCDQAVLMYVDSPSTTSALVYRLQGNNSRDNETIYINRSASDGDNVQTPRGVTTLTLMEIAG